MTAQHRYAEDAERAGQAAHETRDLLNTAILAFETLKRGAVAINGSTGAVLGRSLMSLRDLVNSTLSDIRIAADQQRRERIAVAPFIDDLAVAGQLHAEVRGLTFTSERVELGLFVSADPEMLQSAVTNLLNAFKFTKAGGHVRLRAYRELDRLLIEVEDECGGIPDSALGGLFQPFGDRRGVDRTGLGLGLSIVRKIVRAHGGDVHLRNLPGHGCVFVLVLPLALREAPAQPASA